MSENSREFDPITAVETTAGAFTFVGMLAVDSHIYEDLTHYPATNTNYPAPTANDWHPTTLETGAEFFGPAILVTAAVVAVSSLVRRLIHNHRSQPPRTEVPIPVVE